MGILVILRNKSMWSRNVVGYLVGVLDIMVVKKGRKDMAGLGIFMKD